MRLSPYLSIDKALCGIVGLDYIITFTILLSILLFPDPLRSCATNLRMRATWSPRQTLNGQEIELRIPMSLAAWNNWSAT